MTAKTVARDEDDFEDLPIPPGVRPLSLDEQLALIKEAQDSIARGEIYDEAEADRRIDAIIAGTDDDDVLGCEIVDGKLQPMDRARFKAFIQEGIDDLDAGRWVDHSVIKADIEAMRAELKRQ